MGGTNGAVPRRMVLLGIAGTVVGAAAIGSAPGRPKPSLRELAAEAPDGATSAVPEAFPSPVAFKEISTTAPVSLRRNWKAPIYELDDFLRIDHGAHFPARSVALTIDDGPHPVWTPRYLRLLAKNDIKATFNMIGRQVLPNRHLVRALASEGHVVANHTWSHDEGLPYRRGFQIYDEIHRTNEVIHQVTGVRPTQFRAPGGAWGTRVFAECERLEMLPVGWDVDPRDWARPGVAAIENALLAARPGNILLCHDGGGDRSETFQALQVVLPELKHRGYHFVTLPTGAGPTS
jgi:peptidoglycan/xylan/chitin deacetylase (PgdA/CDA1 family)